MQEQGPSRAENWTAYWSTGALHSCADSFHGNYAGAIGVFWRSVFTGLDQGARVLDLCCGNGPLSKLLLEVNAAEPSFHVDAVDLAQVAMPWLSQLTDSRRAQLRVHPGVDVTALPFADDHFSLCISQYGIEYAGAEAFAEVARVLQPGGKFAAIIHHVDAIPVEIARFEREHVGILLAPDGLYATALDMIEPMSRSGTAEGRNQLKQDPSATSARLGFNAALTRLQTRIREVRYPDVLHEQIEAVMPLLNQVPALGAEAGRKRLLGLRQALLASLQRQQELLEHACDEAQVRDWLRILGDDAPQLQTLRFDNGKIAGWGVRATKKGTGGIKPA